MERVVEHAVELGADRERVWRALTEPGDIARWFPDRADLEVAPGAEGWFVWHEYGRKAVRFDAVEPGRRLVWHWSLESETPVGDGVTTRVEWTLRSHHQGRTILRVRETEFATDEHRQSNVAGWRAELEELIEFLGDGRFVTDEP